MIEKILILFFAALLLHYIYFLLGILKGLNNLLFDTGKNLPGKFTSVIIPFRNESENILNSLKSLEDQNYPKEKFEVIYVNDSSEDGTFEKLIKEKKSENIKVISVKDNNFKKAYKKRAVKFGIENCKGEIIVTTDADCTHNQNWLQTLLSSFDEKTAFVSGPVEFSENTNLFSNIQKLEFAGLILAGAGLIGIHKPVICNGANIAYRKNIYEKLNGFDDQLHLTSGEDELLMQKIHRETNFKIKFCFDKNALVKTKNNSSLKEFLQQRKRWASKSLSYDDKFLILKLIFIFLFYFGLVVQLFLSIFVSIKFLLLFLISIALKSFVEFLILKKGKRNLFAELNLKYFFTAELFQIPYIITAGISGLFGNYVWKGRKIKR